MAKDTEKLIRQLSLISYLMAERRPVTALDIRRDVEGYSDMTEDAFARRFYADRAELDALGIHLTVDKPADGFSEQENYSLAPEAFHLPAIEFTDDERAALQTALVLLDGEFAYAEPLRLALQQITWGRPSPLGAGLRQTIGLGIAATAEAEGNGRARGDATGTIRPERFARLVTLASVLINAGREGRRLPVDEVCDQLKMSPQELREDISVLNVVNFGGGAYVIYAEVLPSGEIEVDPEPYSDTFDRPARLLPIEAKALVAAID